MSKSFGLQLLQQKPLAEPTASFAGKTIIVTGANSGLGLEAATKFVALGATRVILGVRDLEKGNAARRSIEKRTGRRDAAEVWHLDMNWYPSIRAFAKQAEALEQLDVAVLNAGVYMVDYQTSPHGWEETLQVNAVSTTLLALLLLPKLRVSRNGAGVPVLEVVTSRRAEAVTIPPEQRQGNILASLNNPDTFQSSLQYRASKFLALCSVKMIASSVQPTEVIVLAVCPGAAASSLSRGWTGALASIVKSLLNAFFLRTPEQGARSLVSGVTIGADAHGNFWYDDQLHETLTTEDMKSLAIQVWSEITKVLEDWT